MGAYQPDPIKPGIKTTEFYVTIATTIIGILVATGVLQAQGSDELLKAIVTIIGGLATIIPAIVYIIGRFKIKNEALKQAGK